MARKHPTSEQIQSMLREGHFGQSRELPPADPLDTTQMLLEIDRIQPYDRNPRKERNPLYDEIKASIRAQGGLNNPLTITRRPGDSYYIVESGGNTRLQILRELWSETHDERFYRIHCLFRPWVSESHVLTAHLIENDTRGALTFIDKALGVRELREVLESEQSTQLSQRQLAETLRQRGYALDQSMISRMDYAVDALLPLIPEALRAGMGAPQIRRIRRLESACRRFWNDQDIAPELFDALFNEALAAHDGPHWELDAVQRELETRMAEASGLSLKHVRLEIDARLASSANEQNTLSPATDSRPEPSPTVEATGETPPITTTHEAQTAGPADPPRPTPLDETASGPGDPEPKAQPSTRSPDNFAGNETGQPQAPQRERTKEELHQSDAPSYDGPGDLKSLRSRGYVLALKIAKRHDLEDCITPAGKLGMGFLVDIPHESIIPVAGQKDALHQLYRQWVWWLLLSFSEETVQPERMERIPDDLLLRNLILEKNDTQALALVGEPDWKALGYELLNNPSVPQATIDDLLALAQTCRRIRQLMDDDGGLALWQTDG